MKFYAVRECGNRRAIGLFMINPQSPDDPINPVEMLSERIAILIEDEAIRKPQQGFEYIEWITNVLELLPTRKVKLGVSGDIDIPHFDMAGGPLWLFNEKQNGWRPMPIGTLPPGRMKYVLTIWGGVIEPETEKPKLRVINGDKD